MTESGEVFWTLGNRPTQELLGLEPTRVRDLLYAQLLLTPSVVGAASYVFESPTTRQILLGSPELLRSRAVQLYVAHDVEDYRAHAEAKARKSPEALRAAYGHDASSVAEIFDSLAPPRHRPPQDISLRIVCLWKEDILAKTDGSLGETVAWLEHQEPSLEWGVLLMELPSGREGDFVWEYVEPRLRSMKFPQWATRRIRTRLAELYGIAAAAAVALEPDVSSLTTVRSHGAEDARVLIDVFRRLGIFQRFRCLTPGSLLRLREDPSWVFFRDAYQQLIRRFEFVSDDIVKSICVYDGLAQNLGSDGSRLSLRASLSLMFDAIFLDRRDVDKELLADILWSSGEALYGIGQSLDKPRERGLVSALNDSVARVMTNSEKIEMSNLLRSFIVHGHDGGLVLQLKDYIQNTLKWPEPVILSDLANRGRTVIEKFEESAAGDVVFVLFTPDDTTVDGLRYARQNVLFELGYFVGRFGRRSGRVIVLVRGDTDIPSDLAGVVRIDVSNGIVSAGELIRRELVGLGPFVQSA